MGGDLMLSRASMKYMQALFLLGWFLFLPISLAVGSEYRDLIVNKAQQAANEGSLVIDSHQIYARHFVSGIYKLNNYQLLWNARSRRDLITALNSLSADGLNPRDYLFLEIYQYLQLEKKRRLDTAQRLKLDVLLLEGLVRALYNMAFGKVDPVKLDKNINFTRPLIKQELASELLKYIRKGSINELFVRVRPVQPGYQALKRGLAKYRLIQKRGGWAEIPDGKTLRKGEVDTRVTAMRRRLQITGDYPSGYVPLSPDLFDERLETSVKAFQQRHGLEADGIVGKHTLTQLSMPVEDRIEQIRVNLERLRWYMHELEGEFVIVDIASFKAYWVKDRKIIWEEAVQVGKDFTSTPIFKDKIEYLDFNPTWTIPRGIIKRAIQPGLRKDPEYLVKKGYDLLTLDGKPADSLAVDWAAIKGFPYMVRQPPGPDNALGLVKFMFPNSHSVYLHDTNHRELFVRTKRTFSSGCIRVQNPFNLAQKLLADKKGWGRDKIDKIIASGKTTRVRLQRPLRIIIGYRTAFANSKEVSFREDIYNRDQGVLTALNGNFKLRRQDTAKK